MQALTGEQFNTLQESSAEIALYAIQPWLLGTALVTVIYSQPTGPIGADRSLQCVAAVFLLECCRKFPAIFGRGNNAQLTAQFMIGTHTPGEMGR